jgi:predicted GIY-YIG superfamily endonuclease
VTTYKDPELKDLSLPLKHFWLYALKLEQGKYYVGITTKNDPHARIRQHGGVFGARWTMKYKPVETLEVRDIGKITQKDAEQYEQQLTLKYMKQYGTKSVRGGSLTYTGWIFRIGKKSINGYQVETLFTAALLIIVGLYLIFAKP